VVDEVIFSILPEPGTTVAAYYHDKTWNRGVVLKIVEPYDATHSNFFHSPRALVHFLDYGNTEKCSLHQLRKLSPCFAMFNAQVAGCCLSGVGPLRDSDWTTFNVNTHQYIMSDEFAENLTGTIRFVDGRRFLDLVAFLRTSSERPMAGGFHDQRDANFVL
jgi:hypothetical protein